MYGASWFVIEQNETGTVLQREGTEEVYSYADAMANKDSWIGYDELFALYKKTEPTCVWNTSKMNGLSEAARQKISSNNEVWSCYTTSNTAHDRSKNVQNVCWIKESDGSEYTQWGGTMNITLACIQTTTITYYLKNGNTSSASDWTRVVVRYYFNGEPRYDFPENLIKQYCTNGKYGIIYNNPTVNDFATAVAHLSKKSLSPSITLDSTAGVGLRDNGTYQLGRVITLNANGGAVSPESIVRTDETTPYGDLPTPTRNGYEFVGWYSKASGGVKISSTTLATYDIIYAHWNKIYTITKNRAFINDNGEVRSTSMRSFKANNDPVKYTIRSSNITLTPDIE